MPQVEVIHQLAHRGGIERVGRHGLPPNDRRQKAVDHLVGVAPDGRGEVCVDGRRQAVVVVVRGRDRARAEVARLLHAARAENARELVEVGLLRLHAAIERGRELERVGVVEHHAVLLQVLLQAGEGARRRRRVAAEHRELREGARDLARHGDVSEQHELLHLVRGRGRG
eukprot:scaffold29257_cov63-Phaeocystis_antarctica.AAC.1